MGSDALAGLGGVAGGADAHVFNAIAAKTANAQVRNPADRFVVVFNCGPRSKMDRGHAWRLVRERSRTLTV